MTTFKKNISYALGGTFIAGAIITILLLSFVNEIVINNQYSFMVFFLIIAAIFAIVNIDNFIGQFKTFKILDIIVLTVFLILLLIVAYLWQDSVFGVITTITGVLCVFQAARGSIWTFFWGALNVLFYAIYSYMNNYGGDFILNAFFYFPMQFIGLYYWIQSYDKEDDEVEARKYNTLNYIVTIVLIAVGTFVIAYLMPVLNGVFGMDTNPLPYADAFTTTASIGAQIVMTKRFREQWLIWILVNIFSIAMWVNLGDTSMTLMWTAYLVNSLFGCYKWYKR